MIYSQVVRMCIYVYINVYKCDSFCKKQPYHKYVTVQGKSKLNAPLHKLGFPLDCHIYIHTYMYICMYVRMYVCMYYTEHVYTLLDRLFNSYNFQCQFYYIQHVRKSDYDSPNYLSKYVYTKKIASN